MVLRQELQRKVGEAFGGVAVKLGGCKIGERGNNNNVSRAKTVEAVLDFAEASQRFRSRVPDGQPNDRNGI